jgi:hypothetical protein
MAARSILVMNRKERVEERCISVASEVMITLLFSRAENYNEKYDRPRVCYVVLRALDLSDLSIIIYNSSIALLR